MTKRQTAKIIYEACRLEAQWSNRRIVPERFEKRDLKFRIQFVKIIEEYLSRKRLPTPKQAHDSWMREYIKMGWKYGKKRNQIKKIHPDILPFEKLPKDEKDKDAIFLAIVWAIKNSI